MESLLVQDWFIKPTSLSRYKSDYKARFSKTKKRNAAISRFSNTDHIEVKAVSELLGVSHSRTLRLLSEGKSRWIDDLIICDKDNVVSKSKLIALIEKENAIQDSHYTRRKLALLLRVSLSTVCRWENGERTTPLKYKAIFDTTVISPISGLQMYSRTAVDTAMGVRYGD